MMMMIMLTPLSLIVILTILLYRVCHVCRINTDNVQSVFVFTALHVMQTRYCDELSVCLSVRLYICHTRDL